MSDAATGPPGDEWLTLEEAAAYLKVSKQTVYRYCDQGKLRFYKLAGTGQRRFRRRDLEALLEPGWPGEGQPEGSAGGLGERRRRRGSEERPPKSRAA
jgi:excisionase family DNA binding protein